MRSFRLTCGLFTALLLVSAFLETRSRVNAQSTASLQGRVVDATGAVVAGVKIDVHNQATSLKRLAETDSEGNYQVAALPVGSYRIEVRSPGFQTHILENLTIEVGRS